MGQESGHTLAGSSNQDLAMLQLGCQPGLGCDLRQGVLFQAHVVVGRFHFLVAVELIEAYFFFFFFLFF